MKSLFQVPQKVHNAVILMVDLAVNGGPGVFVSLTEVAERQKLSRGFLEEIVAPLRQVGLVKAKRGAYGGYALSRDPSKMTVREIIEAVEGPVTFVDCLGAGGDCALAKSCSSKRLWGRVQERVAESLEEMTLKELV
ncbi:MAG: Rrf2 family transcriptional regulator [Patescibacteria group bacterium]|nr:Rrf2 family transcriptional regulator [Patescibacteria group bacterium]